MCACVCGPVPTFPYPITPGGWGFFLRAPQSQIFQLSKPELSVKPRSPSRQGAPRILGSPCAPEVRTGWLEENLLPDHFGHLDLHPDTSESSAGELPVPHCCSVCLGRAQTRRGKNSSPHLLISPGGMQHCLHSDHAVSRNNLLKSPFWSWGEGDAEEVESGLEGAGERGERGNN